MNELRFALLIFILLSFTDGASAQNMVVVVKGVKNDKGVVRVGIYKAEAEFMKVIWKSAVVQASKGDLNVELENVPAGVYAISVVHDTNNNGKMDLNAMGIPQEGFGFSNDARGLFGPPTWSDSKWEWGGTKNPEIILFYY